MRETGDWVEGILLTRKSLLVYSGDLNSGPHVCTASAHCCRPPCTRLDTRVDTKVMQCLSHVMLKTSENEYWLRKKYSIVVVCVCACMCACMYVHMSISIWFTQVQVHNYSMTILGDHKTTSGVSPQIFHSFLREGLSSGWNLTTQVKLAHTEICLSLPPISGSLVLQACATLAGFCECTF